MQTQPTHEEYRGHDYAASQTGAHAPADPYERNLAGLIGFT